MRWHTKDNREDCGNHRTTLVNRSFWLGDLPRLTPLCRLLGHRPVVGGTRGWNRGPGLRWVECSRCGIRPDPEGSLDPLLHRIGSRYHGPWNTWPTTVAPTVVAAADPAADGRGDRSVHHPGMWPTRPTGTLGGQLVLGRTFGGLSAHLKVGNSGSEHVLAAHLCLGPLGALYLHSESHGQWLQRRLNPTDDQSRVLDLSIAQGRLRWRLWARRDADDGDLPWWRDGRAVLDPRVWLWGPVRNEVTELVGPVPVVVRMPHGDDQHVMLHLHEIRRGRSRGRRRTVTWSVSWDSRHGIATKPEGHGRIFGSDVDVPRASVEQASWPVHAAAAIAEQMTRDRTLYDYRPPETPAAVRL